MQKFCLWGLITLLSLPYVYAQDDKKEAQPNRSQERLLQDAEKADALFNDPETFKILEEGIIPGEEETAKTIRIKQEVEDAQNLYEEYGLTIDKGIAKKTLLRSVSTTTATTTFSNNVSAAVVEDLIMGDELELGIIDEVLKNRFLWKTGTITPSEKLDKEHYGHNYQHHLLESPHGFPTLYLDELTTLSAAEKTSQLIAQLIRHHELGLHGDKEHTDFAKYIFIHQDQIEDKLLLVLDSLDSLNEEYKESVKILQVIAADESERKYLVERASEALKELRGMDRHIKERRKRIHNLIHKIRTIHPKKGLGETLEQKSEGEKDLIGKKSLQDGDRSSKSGGKFSTLISPYEVHSL